jgi:hypothetical protein
MRSCLLSGGALIMLGTACGSGGTTIRSEWQRPDLRLPLLRVRTGAKLASYAVRVGPGWPHTQVTITNRRLRGWL